MVALKTSSQKSSSEQIRRKRHKRASIIIAAIGGATSAAALSSYHLDKKPMYTSQLTGQRWVEELSDMACYWSRKGRISTNLLAACQFCLLFCYLLSGWGGSAADSHVFDNACRTNFPIPPGRYYLADAGFPLCDALLVPYRGVRYHLKEWEQANLRYV